MKKIQILSVMLSLAIITCAQTVTIKSNELLSNIRGFYPLLNQKGDKMLLSTESYVGLSLYDFTNKSLQHITDETGAGFQPTFSNDGQKVFYKSSTLEARLKRDGINGFDLKTNTMTKMVTPQREVKHPQAYGNGFLVLANQKLLKSTFGKTTLPIPNYVWSDGSNLFVFKNNKTHKLIPFSDANGYIWSSLSPDGKMILFTAIAKGTYVCDLNGKIIANLGYLNAPVWYDNQFVVGMKDKDDGHIVTESNIILKSLDGKIEKVLNKSGEICMYPSASATAGKVAYNTDKGAVYVVELSVGK